MKLTKPIFSCGIFPFLTLVFLLQSCNVYHSSTYSLDRAIDAEKKIKVKTLDKHSYKFDRLVSEDENEIVAETKMNSSTYKSLKDDVISTDDQSNTAQIKLDRNQIEKIQVKNQNASTGTKVGVGAIILGIAAAIGVVFLVIGGLG